MTRVSSETRRTKTHRQSPPPPGLLIVVFVWAIVRSSCTWQAKLFRLFQEVLSAPPTKHADELRKLAIYMVRQFGVAAEKNPKIYAELFFWKTIRECNDMENGYEGSAADNGGGKKGWSEEQEDELRRLFEENQANPENDNGNQRHWLMVVSLLFGVLSMSFGTGDFPTVLV